MKTLLSICILLTSALLPEAVAIPLAPINYLDDPGTNFGFFDTTPVSPVGGNTGTTLGQQRRIAMQYAAKRWADQIQGTIPMRIRASWYTQAGNTLASCSSINYFRDPDQATFPLQNVSYPSVLADQLAGEDLELNGTKEDMNVNCNAYWQTNGTSPTDLRRWYYGLDGNAPTTANGPWFDFVGVTFHEIGHGLGFLSFLGLDVPQTSALYAAPNGTIWDWIMSDSSGNRLSTLTGAQRASLGLNNGFFINGSTTVSVNGGSRPRVHSRPHNPPNAPFSAGSWWHHYDEITFSSTGSLNELMTPNSSFPTQVFGPICLGALRDMGYVMADTLPPVAPTLLSPAANSVYPITTFSGVKIAGTAKDTSTAGDSQAVGLLRVRVALSRNSDGRFYNWTAPGGGAFQPGSFDYNTHTKKATLDNLPIATGTRNWELDFPTGLTAGMYQVHVTAVDQLDQGTNFAVTTFGIDAAQSVATVDQPVHGTTLTMRTPLTFSGTASDDLNVTSLQIFVRRDRDNYWWNGNGWQNTPPNGGLPRNFNPAVGTGWNSTGTLPVAGRDMTNGNYTFVALTTDGVLPQYQAGSTITISDTEAPVAVMLSPGNGSVITTPSPVAFNGTMTDNFYVTNFGIYLRRLSDGQWWDGTGWFANTVGIDHNFHVLNNGTWAATEPLPTPGLNMPNGDYRFIVVGNDAAGLLHQLDSIVTIDVPYTWTGGTLRDANPNNDSTFWGTPENWNPVGIPGSADKVIIANGDRVDSTISRTVYSLRLVSGTLNFTNGPGNLGTLTTTNSSTWTGGALTGIWENSPDARITLSGPAAKFMVDGFILNNRGTIIWEGDGTIQAEGNGFAPNPVINNLSGATFEIAANGTLFSRSSYRDGTPLLNNFSGARIVKSGTAGSANIDTFALNNSGEIVCPGGSSIVLNTVSVFTNAGPFSGGGALEVAAGALTVEGNLTADGSRIVLRGGAIYGHANGSATLRTPGSGRIEMRGGQFFNQFTLPSGDRLVIEDPASGALPRLFRDGFILNNHGLVTWAGGSPITVQGDGFAPNPVFNNNNGGLFLASGDGTIFARSSFRDGNPVFNNEAGAVFRKSSGAGDLLFDTAILNNTGALVCDSGVMAFSTVVNHNSTTSLTGSGRYEFRGGTLGITGPLSVANTSFRLLGGNIVSEGATASFLTPGTGRIHAHGGSYFGSYALPTGNQLEIDDPASGALPRLFRDGFILNNSGLVTWAGGSPITVQGDGFDPNPVFNNKNGGLFLASGDGTVFARSSFRAGDPVFNNEAGAVFRKSSGAGDLLFDTAILNNTGALVCDSGVMAFSTVVNHNSTTSLTGSGRYEFRGGTLGITGPLSVANTSFRLLGGNIVSEGATASFLTPGTGRIHAHGGSYFGSYALPADNRLEIDDPASGARPRLFRDGFILNNNGLVTWAGGSPITVQGDGFAPNPVFNNKIGAAFVMAQDGTPFARSSFRDGEPVFNNESGARLIKAGGTGELNLTIFRLINNGSLECASGRMVFNTPVVHESPSPLTGPGEYELSSQSLQLRGPLVVDGTRFTVAGGDLLAHADGSAALSQTGNGSFRAFGGRFFGVWTLASGARMEFSQGPGGPVDKYFADGSVFANRGHIIWLGGGKFLAEGNGFAPNPVFENKLGATFEIAAGGQPFGRSSSRSGNPLFINEAGALFTNSATAAVTVDTFHFDQRARVTATTAELDFNTSLTVANGAVFAGTGGHRVTGGTLTLQGVLAAENSHFSIATGNVFAPANGVGTFSAIGSGMIQWLGGNLFGHFAVTPGTRMNIADPTSGPATKYLADGSIFDNSGIIEWRGAGPIQAEGNGFAANPVFNNLVGATFNANAAGTLNRASYRDGTPIFRNSGTLNLGDPTSEMRFEGWDFLQTTTGSLNLSLAGALPSLLDRLVLNRNATLGGTLNVTRINGFIPVVGDRFTAMTFASRTGTFASINGNGTSYTPEYNGSDFTLIAGESITIQTLAEWTTTYFANPNSPEAQPGANGDHDRMNVLGEYAFGGDPTRSDAAATEPGVNTSGDKLGIVFNRRVGANVTYCVCTSDGLGGWTPLATLAPGSETWTGTGIVSESGTGNMRRMTVRHPTLITPGTRRFLNVSASQ
jgi:hypothetical protein